MTEWTEYIDAVCLKDYMGVVPPLNSHPEYDSDAETWDVYFEYDAYGEHDLVALPFESIEEARKAIQEILDEREKVA